MIKNVIFDFGQVLVRFDPLYMTSKYIADKNEAEAAARVIFDRLYWDRLDDGTIEDGEVVEAVKARLPEHLHEGATLAYYNWIYNIPEIRGMRELICRLKQEKGVRVFVLSNISRYFAEHAQQIPILSYADGCVYSAVCGYVKPDAEIFSHLCDTYDLSSSECVFIDDSQKNINGAEAFGIKGYLFDGDSEKLGAFLDGIL